MQTPNTNGMTSEEQAIAEATPMHLPGPEPKAAKAKKTAKTKPAAKPAGKIKSRPANKTAAAGKIGKKSVPPNKTAAAKPAKKAAKQAEAKKPGRTSGKAKKPATGAESRPEGVRERTWSLMQRKDGVTEREVCEALGWKKAGATISRAVKAAPFKVVKSKAENGRTVYSAAK
jgi:hypothetical protein